MENQESKPQRRVRYKGTHPKSFKEKYKELQPEKYADDIEKIIQKGNTPAGMHRSICVNEILETLDIKPGQVGLDATLGYGGHTLEMIKCLMPGGHLFAIDVDPIELPRTKERLKQLGFGPEVLTIRKMNFSDIDQLLQDSGLFNFVLADLGVSSMQIDNPERGFSVKHDGVLDLRLNPQTGKSAATFLKTVSTQELESLLAENSDEPHAAIIAETIVSQIKKGIPVVSTLQLKAIIKEALERVSVDGNAEMDLLKKTCTRCFQALRIAVNDEFGVLDKLLQKLPDVLAPDGKVAILTFHSGEDRRVKKAFQLYFREGVFSAIAPEPIRPSSEEIFSNPRARSAKLRWAIKA